MEKEPQFIREFSKEESQEERQQTAEAIKAKRAEHFAEKGVQTERQGELQQATGEREKALAEQLQSLTGLEGRIDEISTSGLRKILSYFELRKLEADVSVGQKTYEELKKQQDTDVSEQQAISGKLEGISPEMQQSKAILGDFYKGQKEKWAKSEYTKEDITKYFSEEHLASLSLGDYALLLRRFPGEMVAHVTRQGIRDHTGLISHSRGEGEYTDGFMRIVEDGRLRSPLGVHLVEEEKEQAVASFLHLDEFKSKEEATEYLSRKSLIKGKQGGPGSYTDRMAIHFATEEVANTYYGSEKGNEIFFAFPSALIASQYYFQGQLNEAGGGYHNDQWVWANEEKGIDLNAGLVFIPEEARVDKTTGSRYELDENKKPIKNTEFIDAFRKVVDSPDFHDFAEQAIKITGKREGLLWDVQDMSPKNKKLWEELEPFRQKLGKEFSITDSRLQSTILGYNLQELNVYKPKNGEAENLDHPISEMIERALQENGILFSEAENTVSSKEFWEAYFAKNLAKRPSKIIYYKGEDPTKALLRWREDQGINKGLGDKSAGFYERRITGNAPQATAGIDRFRTLAEQVIDHYFDQK